MMGFISEKSVCICLAFFVGIAHGGELSSGRRSPIKISISVKTINADENERCTAGVMVIDRAEYKKNGEYKLFELKKFFRTARLSYTKIGEQGRCKAELDADEFLEKYQFCSMTNFTQAEDLCFFEFYKDTALFSVTNRDYGKYPSVAADCGFICPAAK